jgi:hypothetical protein
VNQKVIMLATKQDPLEHAAVEAVNSGAVLS